MRRTVRAMLSASLVLPGLLISPNVAGQAQLSDPVRADLVTIDAAGLGAVASGAPEQPRGPLTPLNRAAQELKTGFERSGGYDWTTIEQEHEFVRELDERSNRVAVDRVGSTLDDRPLQLVQVGHPRPEPERPAAEGSVVFFVCSQHGNEPAPREACLQLARDLAFTNNPSWVRLLRHTTVLFITANPDGRVANTRGNANGVDINRDYLAQQTPEARAITRIMRDWNPDVAVDMHEYGGEPGVYDAALTHLWPRNRNVDDRVYQQSKRLNNRYAVPEVETLGYDTGIYGFLYHDGEPFAQVSGDGQARKLRNYVGMRHSVGMLTESYVDPINAEEGDNPAALNKRRVRVQHAAATGTLRMALEDGRQLDRVTERAARRAKHHGGTPEQVVYFDGEDNRLPTDPDDVDLTPPCGYGLTTDEYQTVRRSLRTQGIEISESDGSHVVSMQQPTSMVIPSLLDKRAQHNLVDAEPLENCSG